jgi:hypothetical protein
MELITKLSGLPKAITYTRIICRVNIKTMKMYKTFIIKFSITSIEGQGWKALLLLLAKVGILRAANVPDISDRVKHDR